MRLRTRRQYQRMVHNTTKFKGRWILVDVRKAQGDEPFSKLGITVTKRYGNAVQRNRFKRIVREAFRLSRTQFSSSFDIMIRPRTEAMQAKSSDIQQELLNFLNNHGFS